MEATKEKSEGGISLAKLRRQFQTYATAKVAEIAEAREAHAYYSGKQYTAEQRRILGKRGQPPITFNRIARKINGVVGTVRKLRTDPKAFPRRKDNDEAAELATQVVRYICDASDFENIEGEALFSASVYGYAFCEMSINGQQGNPDIGLIEGDPRTFFYDPRSIKPDFSDARFMGTYKWVSEDELEEIIGEMGGEPHSADGSDYTTAFESRADEAWVDERKRAKLVDHWYIEGGKWRWCLHLGSVKIRSGDSPFYDEDGKSISKFRAWSCFIDDDGDRYGFGRDLKGPQDVMNHNRSKMVWISAARQIVARRGALQDVEYTRSQAMKADGIIEYDGDPADFRIEQPSQEFIQQSQLYQEAKDEIENFGPNPAIVGTNVQAKSGRAYAMLQQSALAELGMFLKNYRMWKLGIYKAVWGAAKAHWKAPRWLRVTGDADVAQFVQINELQMDEYGQPVIANQIGAVDVDIVMDEGPDSENVMGDVFDTLQAIAGNGIPVPPQVIIEMSALPNSVKEKLVEMMQPPPEAAMAGKIKMDHEAAKAEKTKADAYKVTTDAWINEQQLGMNVMQQQFAPDPMQQQMQPAPPMPMDQGFDQMQGFN